MGSLATHQTLSPLTKTTLGKQYEKNTYEVGETPWLLENFSRAPKMEYAAGMNPNMCSYSSETIQSVFTHISIHYRRGGEIAKPDHFKRQMHRADMKVNPVIMAY